MDEDELEPQSARTPSWPLRIALFVVVVVLAATALVLLDRPEDHGTTPPGGSHGSGSDWSTTW